MDLLISGGANVNAADKDGDSCLAYAIALGKFFEFASNMRTGVMGILKLSIEIGFENELYLAPNTLYKSGQTGARTFAVSLR